MESHCPNCRQCEHFQTTWDNAAPLGCRKFGFKTRTMPSLEVLATTGKHCIFFEPKGDLPSSQAPPPLPDHSSFQILG